MADNMNISPEMIDNLVNILKNSNSSNSSSNEAANSDSSSTNIGEIFKNFSSNSNKNTTEPNEDNSSSNMDFDTIMKIKSMMDTLNTKNDPDSNLLYSLKPYLRKTRQAKLDQYINILKVSQMSRLFKNEKGEDK